MSCSNDDVLTPCRLLYENHDINLEFKLLIFHSVSNMIRNIQTFKIWLNSPQNTYTITLLQLWISHFNDLLQISCNKMEKNLKKWFYSLILSQIVLKSRIPIKRSSKRGINTNHFKSPCLYTSMKIIKMFPTTKNNCKWTWLKYYTKILVELFSFYNDV